MRFSPEDIHKVLFDLFTKHSFDEEKAKLLADVFVESTVDGVSSHGVNRVPLFIDHVKKGIVKVDTEPEKVASFGNMERWDGNLGAGILNATKCTSRATELAKQYGMGMVALRNTNHWMRGGTYGKQAANADCISILFTNTKPNMPPWGGKESRIGNNPFVVSIPRENGHVVLDMAMSQFSFGKINDYRLRGEKLPFHGGWDDSDELSDDPEKILSKERGLPMGYWKGSALSMVIYPEVFGDKGLQQTMLDEIIAFTHDVETMDSDSRIYYPGERSAQTRKRNLEEGIFVNDSIWLEIVKLGK